MKKYYVYILRCEDMSLYTGITTDIEKRLKEHITKKGAKYTKSRGVKKLEIYFSCNGRSEASRIEYFFKKLSKRKKEELILDFKGLKECFWKELRIEIKNIEKNEKNILT